MNQIDYEHEDESKVHGADARAQDHLDKQGCSCFRLPYAWLRPADSRTEVERPIRPGPASQ
jgi:hypothetical protein